MDLPGCSKEKALPARCLSRHLSAAPSAISVSFSKRILARLDIRATSAGIPVGNSSDLKGKGGFLTFGIGISLAREKVAQFGAQWLKSATSVSKERSSESTKTSRPRRMSQGGKIKKEERSRVTKSPTHFFPPRSSVGRRFRLRSCPYSPVFLTGPPSDLPLVFPEPFPDSLAAFFFLSRSNFLQPSGILQRGSWYFLQIMQ